MTRALLCSVFLLSLSCSSGSSDGGTTTGGSGGNSSGGGNHQGGSSGSGNNSAGTSSGGTTANAGGGGTTGNAGAGGATGNAGAGGTGATPSTSVTQWGGDIARSAHYVAPSLTMTAVKAMPSKLLPDTFTAPAGGVEYAGKFAGEIAAIPLYLAGATAGTGEYIVSTTQNDVYAFNESTGALKWKHNVGANLDQGTSQCGSPANHGIVGTPVIDAAARVIYLAAGMADAHKEIHALNADTGMEMPGGWPVDVSKFMVAGQPFVSDRQSQRSALSLVAGVVYVAFGGYCGDQGAYHGVVIGVNSKDPTKTGSWATMDQMAGIWAPGGMPSDGTGVFAVTGNTGGATDHNTSDSEEIIRITGLGVGHRDAQNMFVPTEWVNPMNSNDQDFGSSSPAVFTVPNSTPSTLIAAPSKPGRLYFLDAGNLGGPLGQIADMAVADTGASSSLYTAPSAYQSATGVHVALVTGKGSQCPDPVGTNDGSVMSILVQPGVTPDKAPMPKIAWCAKVGTGATDPTDKRSPASTNSSGNADSIVWLMDGSKLKGFDGDTGAVVFDSGASTCGGVHSFTQVIVANGHVVTAGDGAGQAHLCSWSVHN